MKNKKTTRILFCVVLMAVMVTMSSVTAFAAGDVETAIEGTWTSAQMQIKNVVNNVVFPVVDIDVYKRQVFIEEPPRAILTPEKESVRQRGGHFKEPDEPMFTITTQDRRGIIHRGRVRKLTPREFMETDFTQEDEQAEENNMQLGGLNL